MKSKLILPLIVIAVIIATLLHQFKSPDYSEDTQIEKLAGGMKYIRYLFSAHKNISINTTDLNGEVYLWSRYLLAPCYCPDAKNVKLDSVLEICKISTPDSAMNSIIGNRIIIWSNKDDLYRYYLTRNK